LCSQKSQHLAYSKLLELRLTAPRTPGKKLEGNPHFESEKTVGVQNQDRFFAQMDEWLS
jgi:hypothetical protein